MEVKTISYKIEGTMLVISVDPNKDGNPVLEVRVPLVEVLNEIGSLIAKK